MNGTKRARSIPSLVSHNQCGGPKKSGSVGNYMIPRNNWLGGASQRRSLHVIFKLCSDIPKSKQTMNPQGAGGVGRRLP
mgnify:FL=1